MEAAGRGVDFEDAPICNYGEVTWVDVDTFDDIGKMEHVSKYRFDPGTVLPAESHLRISKSYMRYNISHLRYIQITDQVCICMP